MAVEAQLNALKAKLKFDTTEVTVGGCIPTATDEQVYAFAQALGGLNNKVVKSYAKVEELELLDFGI